MAYYLVEAVAKEERFPELSERLSRTAFPRCGPPPLLSIADVLLRVLHLSERTPVGNAFSRLGSGRSINQLALDRSFGSSRPGERLVYTRGQ